MMAPLSSKQAPSVHGLLSVKRDGREGGLSAGVGGGLGRVGGKSDGMK